MRTADNRIGTLIDLYGSMLSGLYPEGEVKAIVRAVFHDRMGLDPAQIELRKGDLLSESELLAIYQPLMRLKTGEPLQYVLGHQWFHGLDLAVGPGVLIPRPETEELVERIINEGPVPRRIVDIGTGSGCIALALKRAFPNAVVTGIDVSPAALALAQRNAELLGLQVDWVLSDALDAGYALPYGLDLVVSNPPYVPLHESESLATQVRDHEPHLALFVDDVDPLVFYRAIAERAFFSLVPGGRLWFEGHHIHTPEVGALLERRGYGKVHVHKDLSGQFRFISAQR